MLCARASYAGLVCLSFALLVLFALLHIDADAAKPTLGSNAPNLMDFRHDIRQHYYYKAGVTKSTPKPPSNAINALPSVERQILAAEPTSTPVELTFDFSDPANVANDQKSSFMYTLDGIGRALTVIGEPFLPKLKPADNFGATALKSYCDALAATEPSIPMRRCGLQGPKGSGAGGIDKGHIVAKSIGGNNDDPLNLMPQWDFSNQPPGRWRVFEIAIAEVLKTPECMRPAVLLRIELSYAAQSLVPEDGTYSVGLSAACFIAVNGGSKTPSVTSLLASVAITKTGFDAIAYPHVFNTQWVNGHPDQSALMSAFSSTHRVSILNTRACSVEIYRADWKDDESHWTKLPLQVDVDQSDSLSQLITRVQDQARIFGQDKTSLDRNDWQSVATTSTQWHPEDSDLPWSDALLNTPASSIFSEEWGTDTPVIKLYAWVSTLLFINVQEDKNLVQFRFKIAGRQIGNEIYGDKIPLQWRKNPADISVADILTEAVKNGYPLNSQHYTWTMSPESGTEEDSRDTLLIFSDSYPHVDIETKSVTPVQPSATASSTCAPASKQSRKLLQVGDSLCTSLQTLFIPAPTPDTTVADLQDELLLALHGTMPAAALPVYLSVQGRWLGNDVTRTLSSYSFNLSQPLQLVYSFAAPKLSQRDRFRDSTCQYVWSMQTKLQC